MTAYEIGMLIFTGIIAASAFYALVFQLRGMVEERRARESETVMRITQRWDSEDLIKARQLIARYKDNLKETIENFDKLNRTEYFDLVKVPNFFEDIASLVDKGYLREKVIKDLLGDSAAYYYDLYRNYITAARHYDADLYEHFERLANK